MSVDADNHPITLTQKKTHHHYITNPQTNPKQLTTSQSKLTAKLTITNTNHNHRLPWPPASALGSGSAC
jgi:hypothetical protein